MQGKMIPHLRIIIQYIIFARDFKKGENYCKKVVNIY